MTERYLSSQLADLYELSASRGIPAVRLNDTSDTKASTACIIILAAQL